MANRSIVGEYESGKLTHVKAILESRGYNVNAILVCAEPYASNPDLFNNIIENQMAVHFIFREDLQMYI